MSFVDLIGILLVISICYVGYLKGLKNQLFFIISFGLSSFILYLFFKPVFGFVNAILKNQIVSGFVVITFIAMPLFLVIEWCFRKLFTTEKTSFSSSRSKISFVSRLTSAIISFIFGYIFIFATVQGLKQNSLEKSFFYDAILKKAKDEEDLKLVSILYSKETALKLALSKDEVSEIAKMVKSLSSQKIKDLSEFLKENAQIEEAIVKLGDLYFEDKGQINNNIQRFKTIKGEPKPEVEPPFEVLSN